MFSCSGVILGLRRCALTETGKLLTFEGLHSLFLVRSVHLTVLLGHRSLHILFFAFIVHDLCISQIYQAERKWAESLMQKSLGKSKRQLQQRANAALADRHQEGQAVPVDLARVGGPALAFPLRRSVC